MLLKFLGGVEIKTKIALIGAGSASFGFGTIYDIVKSESLHGSTLALIDIDSEKLKLMEKVAEKLNTDFKAGLKIEASTDAKDVLDGSEFVIISAEKERIKRWKMDYEIPLKYGIKQVLGENGGPGGLAHTLRVVPLILEICKDIEDYCPDALILNYTNPEGRVCLAIKKATKLNVVGLCPGIYGKIRSLASLLNTNYEDLEAIAAGLNHFTWILELRFKNGKSAYPMLREKLKNNPDFEPLSQELFYSFGYYPSPSDNHVGEYVPYAWEKVPEKVRGINWIKSCEEAAKKLEDTMSKLLTQSFSEEHLQKMRMEKGMAVNIITAIIENKRYLEYAVNIPNNGYITNLSQGVIVEVPAIVDSSGIRGVGIGALPKGIAALVQLQATITELSVEAAIEGSYEKALEALLIDPVVNNIDAAKAILDEFLKVHAPLLPQFSK